MKWHLRRSVREFVAHYHAERNYQGIGKELIDRPAEHAATGPVRRVDESAKFSITTTGRPRRHGHNGVVGQYGSETCAGGQRHRPRKCCHTALARV